MKDFTCSKAYLTKLTLLLIDKLGFIEINENTKECHKSRKKERKVEREEVEHYDLT